MDNSRSKLIELQRVIFKNMKKKALEYEKETSKELKSYRKNHALYSQRDFKVIETSKLIEELKKAGIAYFGDFHTFDQNGRNMQRILKSLLLHKRTIILGVEFIHHRYQKTVDQFINHHITELEFLEKIEYQESWKFPWAHYQQFFLIAREKKLKVLALNSEGSLEERDQFAANIISKNNACSSEYIFLVFFGELHIMPNKLPKLVTNSTTAKIKQMIIYQNLDDVYWRLSEKEAIPSSQIIQFNEQEYSMQTSPPWIKYESMIYWYESICDDPEFDIHEYIMETGSLLLNSNGPDHFLYLSKEISNSLNLCLTRDQLEDFNLYDHEKLSIIFDKIDHNLNKKLSLFCSDLITDGKSFKIPFSSDYYCSSYSINRISFIVGIHLHNIILKKQQTDYENILAESSNQKKFLHLLYQNIMGYLCSKVINPYRKCNQYDDLIVLSKDDSQNTKNKKYINKSIEILDLQDFTNLSQNLKGLNLMSLYQVSRSIGFIFADNIYTNYVIKKTASLDRILNLILNTKYCPQNLNQLRYEIQKNSPLKGPRKRYF